MNVKIVILFWSLLGVLPACWIAQKSLKAEIIAFNGLPREFNREGWQAGQVLEEYSLFGHIFSIRFHPKFWIPIAIFFVSILLLLLTWSLLPFD